MSLDPGSILEFNADHLPITVFLGDESAGEFESVSRVDGVQQQMRRCAGGLAENPEEHQCTKGGAEQQVSHMTSQSEVA